MLNRENCHGGDLKSLNKYQETILREKITLKIPIIKRKVKIIFINLNKLICLSIISQYLKSIDKQMVKLLILEPKFF